MKYEDPYRILFLRYEYEGRFATAAGSAHWFEHSFTILSQGSSQGNNKIPSLLTVMCNIAEFLQNISTTSYILAIASNVHNFQTQCVRQFYLHARNQQIKYYWSGVGGRVSVKVPGIWYIPDIRFRAERGSLLYNDVCFY